MTEELEDYIDSHISPEPDYLKRVEKLSNVRYINGRMCSGHIQGRLLKMLTAMINPARVLEIGTFSGYSALCIAEGLSDNAVIDTVEIDDELEDFITENFAFSPVGHKINLHIEDAVNFMKKKEPDSYDMIFIDGDKRKYCEFLEGCLPLLRPGGFIIADNTLWDGHVVETGKHSSQTSGILKFNETVASNKELETAIVPIRDGLTIIRKIEIKR